MKLSKERIFSLSQTLLDRLIQGQYIKPQMDRKALAAILEQIITDELSVEDRLNEEVKEILSAYEAEIDRGNPNSPKHVLNTKKRNERESGSRQERSV